MLERPVVTPGITAGELVDQNVVITHLQQWQADTQRTREAVQAEFGERIRIVSVDGQWVAVPSGGSPGPRA